MKQTKTQKQTTIETVYMNWLQMKRDEFDDAYEAEKDYQESARRQA